MDTSRWKLDPLVITAMVGSAIVGAQYIAGKAARDTLFLTYFEASSVPRIKVAMAVFSIVLVILSTRVLKRVAPATWVPIAFVISAILFVVEFVLARTAPRPGVSILYLHISSLGPLLGSGFWLITSESFDPYTAKKHFGQIAGAGTLAGFSAALVGYGLASWDQAGGTPYGTISLLPALGAANAVCAWQIRRLAKSSRVTGHEPTAAETESAPSGLRVLAGAPYLRALAALVFLGAIAAAFVDLAFVTQVKATFGKGPELGKFFSRYNAALSLITFLVQTTASRIALERLGLAVAAATPGTTFLVGGATTLLFPGFWSVVTTRWTEAVLRASVYRAGYELFYTPIPPKEKRAVKSIIDVGVDRSADIVGNTVLALLPRPGITLLMSVGMGCSAVAVLIGSRLKRGYTQTLEKSLLNRAVELDLSEVEDLTTRTTMLRTLSMTQPMLSSAAVRAEAGLSARKEAVVPPITDPAIQQIMILRSRDRQAILQVLRDEKGLGPTLVPHVIPLLAWDEVGHECVRALRGVAEERVGELIDALLDPNQPFAVRRRLARVFTVCVSQRATDGLLLGLEDLRFEVRFQCGRSLLAIIEKNPRVRIDKDRVFSFVMQEVAVSQSVWEGRKLLDGPDEGDRQSFLEELVKDRANQSLAHVFTLLALVLPTEPLRIAFRGLHTDDQGLRGTALEYLESVLPAEIRDSLWPFVENRRAPAKSVRPREEALAELLRSNQSIMINLEELKKRGRLSTT